MISGIAALVLSFFFDSIVFTVWGIPAVAFLFQLLHETSHVIGCRMIGVQVNYVEVFGFRYSKEKHLEVTDRLTVYGCVNFRHVEKSRVIFLAGLVGSAIFTGAVAALYFCDVVGPVYAAVVGLCMLILMIPCKGSDIVRVFGRQ